MRNVVFGLVAMMLVGCSPYINIPKQPADVATHSPNDGTVVRVMGAALSEVLQQRSDRGDYAIALPNRASKATYQQVLQRTPDGGTRHAEGATGLPVYSVAGVYVRGPKAQVDIVRPTAGGQPQLVSIYMDLAIDGWYARRVRPWSIPVAEALNIAYPGDEIE